MVIIVIISIVFLFCIHFYYHRKNQKMAIQLKLAQDINNKVNDEVLKLKNNLNKINLLQNEMDTYVATIVKQTEDVEKSIILLLSEVEKIPNLTPEVEKHITAINLKLKEQHK